MCVCVCVCVRACVRVCVSKLSTHCCLQGEVFSYEPGDAVSVICPNPPKEVNLLLNRYTLDYQVDMYLELICVQIRFDVMC